MQIFESRAALAAALAQATAQALAASIKARGRGLLAVSGGRTPVLFFEALSRMQLSWPDIVVTLVDERWVPEDNPRSNAALVRRHLLVNNAAAATFLPLYNGAATPVLGVAALEKQLADQPLPLAAAILGMGEDGHTASFFPGGNHLAMALDQDSGALLASMEAPGAEEPRMTLTLPVLTQASFLALHIEGEGKREVLARARKKGADQEMPVRAVLRCTPRIYWCP